jgi:hypothetical protein
MMENYREYRKIMEYSRLWEDDGYLEKWENNGELENMER